MRKTKSRILQLFAVSGYLLMASCSSPNPYGLTYAVCLNDATQLSSLKADFISTVERYGFRAVDQSDSARGSYNDLADAAGAPHLRRSEGDDVSVFALNDVDRGIATLDNISRTRTEIRFTIFEHNLEPDQVSFSREIRSQTLQYGTLIEITERNRNERSVCGNVERIGESVSAS